MSKPKEIQIEGKNILHGLMKNRHKLNIKF